MKADVSVAPTGGVVIKKGLSTKAALRAFGFSRCLAESNWFVSRAHGRSYARSFEDAAAACAALGATDAEARAVFADNARRIYRLDDAGGRIRS